MKAINEIFWINRALPCFEVSTIQPYLSFLSFIVHQDINLQITVFSDDICL